MSANVALSETFDQWRVKTNELLVMTQTDGSPNFVKLTNTTDATSNTSGSIITAGGIGVSKSVRIGENLNVHGNIHANGAITADGNLTLGSDTTDSVTVSADFTSDLIPNANDTYSLGSTSQQWANLFATTARLKVSASGTKSGVPALVIDHDDNDVTAVTVSGDQTTVPTITVDSNALTTSSAVKISENSGDTNARKTLHVLQNNVSALQATAMCVQSLGGRIGQLLDKNYTDTGSATVIGQRIDFDQTAAAGAGTFTNIGLDIDVLSSHDGTGSHTSTGLKVNMSGTTGTRYSGIFLGGNTGFGVSAPAAKVDISSSGAQLKLYDGTSGGVTFTTSGTTTTVTGSISSTFTGDVTGSIIGATAAMTGNITTTSDIGANTASITTGAALDVKGAIALSQEMAAPSNVADTGFLFANTDGSLIFMNQAGTQTNLSAAASGASLVDENAFTRQQYFDDQALTSGASVSWNANTAQVATLNLGHNATVANATNHKSGGTYILRVTQNTAPKTLAWSTGYKWPGNTAPVMTATGGAIDVFTFVSDGTYMYGSFSGSQNFT